MGLAEVELVEDVDQHGEDVAAVVTAIGRFGGDPRILHLKMVFNEQTSAFT